MQIKQEPKFQPITIILETSEEAEALWEAVRYAIDNFKIEFTVEERNLLVGISDWFSQSAQL